MPTEATPTPDPVQAGQAGVRRDLNADLNKRRWERWGWPSMSQQHQSSAFVARVACSKGEPCPNSLSKPGQSCDEGRESGSTSYGQQRDTCARNSANPIPPGTGCSKGGALESCNSGVEPLLPAASLRLPHPSSQPSSLCFPPSLQPCPESPCLCPQIPLALWAPLGQHCPHRVGRAVSLAEAPAPPASCVPDATGI